MTYGISIIVIAVIIAAAVIFMAVRSRRTTNISAELKTRLKAAGAKDEGDETPQEDGAAELDQVRLIVHGLLQGVSDSIESLLNDSTKYGDSLDEHEAALTRSRTIDGIRELEAVMLAGLSQMQSANQHYRSQLDEANTKARAQQEELERLQTDVGIDYLTKIPNRRSFVEKISEEMERAKRYKTKFTLVVLDLDHFKTVNDKYGHLAGDRILRAVANLLDHQRRSTDFLARFGGEEFALILPETTQERAWVLAEKTRRKVEQSRFRYEEHPIHITISMGVGEVHGEEDTPELLFERVDQALYRAKHLGRNRVEVVNDSSSKSD